MPCRLLLLSALFLTSCGSSYHSAFKKAKQPAGNTVEGAWKGTWQSNINGHHGPLWCIVTQNKETSSQWNFRYRAGWSVLQFGDFLHQTPAKLDPNGNLPLTGRMILPNNFGTYSVEGQLTPTQFNLRYQGSGDRGTITLIRP